MKHQDITGFMAVHPFAFVGASDPASDPDNEVAANKAWIDTSGGAGNYTLKVRNSSDDGWETISGGGGGGGGGTSVVVDETGTTYNVLAADNTKYIRLTNTSAKSIIVDPESTEALPDNGEWHFRNVGTADATVVPGTGVTVTPPAGGTLVIPQDGTVTLKRIAEDEFDLIGQTVAA